MTSTRPVVRDVLRGVIIAALVLLTAGTTLALRAQATTDPYTLTRDGIELTVPLEDNGHLNVRTDTGATYNLHAESKCITRTDAECTGSRHDVAQYIGRTFIPWSVIGVPPDACVAWVQRSGENHHYGEHGEPAFCLTEEEPCPTETPTTPAPEPSASTSPEPSEPPTPEPSDEPSSIPTGSPTQPGSSPSSSTPSETPVSTDPTPTSPEPDESTTTPTAPEDYGQGDDEGNGDVTYASEVSAVEDDATVSTDAHVLAATGVEPWFVIGGAALLTILGGILIGIRRMTHGGGDE